MKQQLQVVFEKGVFRPIEPVAYAENQQLLVTVVDAAAGGGGQMLSAEQRWLREQGQAFAGEWVALDGNRLLSHGLNARTVYDEARAAGVAAPFFVRVAVPDELPSGGW